MLTAYADESGHSKHPNCNFVALAGFVGSKSEWDSFGRDWKSATDKYIAGSELHMKNFGRGKLYAGWSETERENFMNLLVAAIVDSGVHGVACAVSLSAFSELSAKHQAAVVDPYYMAFQEVTKGLALRGAPVESPDLKVDPVAMVYAYQREYGATPAGCQGRSKTLPVGRSKSRPINGCEVVEYSWEKGRWSVAEAALLPRGALGGVGLSVRGLGFVCGGSA